MAIENIGIFLSGNVSFCQRKMPIRIKYPTTKTFEAFFIQKHVYAIAKLQNRNERLIFKLIALPPTLLRI